MWIPCPVRVGDFFKRMKNQRTVRDIFKDIEWNPVTAHQIARIVADMEEAGKHISDPSIWLNSWKEYLTHVDKLLEEKANNIVKLKNKLNKVFGIYDTNDQKIKNLSYIIEKEKKELLVISGAKTFMDNSVNLYFYYEDRDSTALKKLKESNILLFSLAEKYEELYKQSAEGESVLINKIIKLLQENEVLKQQVTTLKNQVK